MPRRALLARVRAALDEREAALDDFGAVLDLAPPPPEDPAGTPVHLALHNLEQLDYLERLHGLTPGTLLPLPAARREEKRRQANQILDKAGTVAPRIKLEGAWGRALAEPPRMRGSKPSPDRVLNPRNDGAAIAQSFRDGDGVACVAPESGGLEMWNVAAPADWTFNDYNADGYRIRLHLSQIGARQKSFAYAENRALLFRGMLFRQTSACRFAEGFENRRRNITMLFRRSRKS